MKTAVGGTALYGAWNPHWSADKMAFIERDEKKRKLKLIEQHHHTIRHHLATLNKPYQIVGMAWMQGETDTRTQESSSHYLRNLTTLIADYRHAFQTPEMPFVMGQVNMVRSHYKPGITKVREAIATLARQDPYSSMVATSLDPSWSDFPKHKDNTHYNTQGQQRLGTAMAHKLMPYLAR